MPLEPPHYKNHCPLHYTPQVVPAGDQQADLQLLDALDEDEAADEWARAFDSPQQEGKLAQGVSGECRC